MTKTPINTRSSCKKWKLIKKNYSPMIQLNLFPNTIKQAFMIAHSPRKAFYNLWLEEWNGKYQIRKESGANSKVLDKRLWKCKSLDKAEKMFEQTIKQKTNPDRKWSPRKYQLV